MPSEAIQCGVIAGEKSVAPYQMMLTACESGAKQGNVRRRLVCLGYRFISSARPFHLGVFLTVAAVAAPSDRLAHPA
jgi:hypothetical protein